MNKSSVADNYKILIKCVFVLFLITLSGCVEESKEKPSFIEIGKEYDAVKDFFVRDVFDVGGKPAFIVDDCQKKGNCKWFVAFDGKESKRYDTLWISTSRHSIPIEPRIYDIDGKPTFVAGRDQKWLLVFTEVEGKPYEKIEIDKDNRGDIPYQVQNIGGKPAYIVSENNKMFVVHGDKEGKRYIAVNKGSKNPCITDIKGEPVYGASEPPGKWFIVVGDKEIGKEYSPKSWSFISVNDKLGYIGSIYEFFGKGIRPNRTDAVFFDDKKGKEYDYINELTVVDDTFAYYAKKGSESFVVINETEGKHYDSADIFQLTDVGGKLAYIVKEKKENKSFVVFDNIEGKKSYEGNIGYLTDVNGKPAYIVFEKEKSFIVYDEVKIKLPKDYKIRTGDDWPPILDVNGKLVYSAYRYKKEGGTENIIIYNGIEIGKEYSGFRKITKIGNKLAFIAYKDDKNVIVIQE